MFNGEANNDLKQPNTVLYLLTFFNIDCRSSNSKKLLSSSFR
jgi:hypothetical protein